MTNDDQLITVLYKVCIAELKKTHKDDVDIVNKYVEERKTFFVNQLLHPERFEVLAIPSMIADEVDILHIN